MKFKTFELKNDNHFVDMLLITGSNDKAGIAKLKEVAKKSFETGNYQVSEYLYKWNGKKFEKYE